MENLEQRFEERRKAIAAAIPGYPGYAARERRRDADRALRIQLARQYQAQRDRLTDLQRQAANKALLSALDDLERAGRKLQHFIDRLRTASYGYAGWFDSASIGEPELEQLYAFDQALATGIPQVTAAIDSIAQAIEMGTGIETAADALGSTIDELNRRFDQRRDLLAEGRQVPPNELPTALETPALPPPAAYVALTRLHVEDALTYDGVDYLIEAKITYETKTGQGYAYQLADTQDKRWLRVGLPEPNVGLYEMTGQDFPTPGAETVKIENTLFQLVEAAPASAEVEGPGGRRSGTVQYWLYASEAGDQFWIEQWGPNLRIHRGQAIDPELIQVWPRNPGRS